MIFLPLLITYYFVAVLRGQDPSVNVVLLEDMAAVLGVGVALSCMGLTQMSGSHIPDALGSCIIGCILAGVSGFIVYTNSVALVGRYELRYLELCFKSLLFGMFLVSYKKISIIIMSMHLINSYYIF